ncbi:histidine kinase/DNA gyrase B/HSP90-like ATPase [Hydrogenoanaerobacterium saccharovorans]|uniref:Histidine kinase-, DNA gyrase B-, and HSP90-like ATPase n=1 Tax=Hydrogenoanaerobacterium saccharovorans TaxID=474960 RepID=A0A1H8BSR2_9FIRM|nr:histidine kinase [Hydrogenoanaerobacterium saccharovorans]RPF47256.1 histidine kinase/DNA gyrase B/HSP90-like ATPase [Hydrogenoanaerobacterium saccharovorans]SEM85792.1 Histidine kinase-, DNA gyrase B-, and HSP90-like ATPase [Hydrogenoanaerobacterium saccharovorans]
MHKIKRFFWRFSSVKQELIFYNIVLFVFVFAVVIILNFSNLKTISAYADFSAQYSTLSSFYKNVKAADQLAQNCLYTGSVEEQAKYNLCKNDANHNINDLSNMFEDEKLRWRFGRLKNMVQTYDEVFLELREKKDISLEEYNIKYDFLVDTAKNIDLTATQFYNLLTDEMNRQSKEMIRNWQVQAKFIILLTAGMIVIAIAFSAMCIKDITQPIGRIVKNIQKIKMGKYDLKQVKHAGKEISILCDAFDDMAKSVQGHILSVEENAKLEKELLEKENENLKISELLMETELKALQGQMNPHFLFNTLSMISKMAYMEQAEQTSEMMETVSDLLRYSLDKSSKTSDLYNEIECAQNYLIIQRKRFGHRVKFELFVAEDVPNITMPGMIFQPLIENAVIHGVGQLVQNAFVSIQVIRDETKIYIVFEDNGKGMESDLVESILTGRRAGNFKKSNGTNIGMNNVFRRLEMFYGPDSTVQIESSIDCGTVIILTLPIAAEEEEEQDV